MFSPTFISPHISLFQPSIPKHFQKTNITPPLNFPSFSTTSHYSSTSLKYPDANNPSTSHIPWMVDSTLFASWFQSSSSVKQVRRLHAIVITCFNNPDTFVFNNLITAYVRFGSLIEAHNVFDKMPDRNVVSWTAILNGYLRFGLDDEALRFYVRFVESGVRANSKTFVCVLNLCSRRLDFELGKQVHACVIKENCSNLIVDSAAVHFYAQCGDLSSAFEVFDRMGQRDVVCWTMMISACSQHGWGEEAFKMFSQMICDEVPPNEFTICSVLKACGEEKGLQIGRQLHGAIVKKIFRNDVFLGTSLVDMYAKCGEIEDSRAVFDGMRKRNMVTWTSIIAGYARNGFGEEAIDLFRVMKRRNISANNLTMVSLLRACGLIRALSTGKEVHAQIVKNYLQSNIYLESTLVWLYCKCGEYPTALKVLEEMPLRDVVSWTAMISGCARLGHETEALEFLKEMLGEGVEPNPFTYSSALKACAKLENICQGKSIHSSIQKTPALSNVFVGSALINMYAKCGYVSEAVQVFDSMPERNLVSWKAMVVGYAKSGLRREAMKLMYQMQAEGVEVDDYILSTVLTACGDSEWSREPPLEHCLQSS